MRGNSVVVLMLVSVLLLDDGDELREPDAPREHEPRKPTDELEGRTGDDTDEGHPA